MKNADASAVAGNGNITDYDALTGGVLSGNMNAFTAGDEGILSNTSKGKTQSARYTPPAWLRASNNATNKMGTAALNSGAPVVNGQVATGPLLKT